MFKYIDKLFAEDIGIDLGTANTLVFIKGKGIVINEPSIVAINEKTGRIIAVGTEAKEMIGRTPTHIKAIWPLVDGVISNFEVAQEMLAYLIRRVTSGSPMKQFFRPRVVVGVPSGITEVETRAVRDATKNAGAGRVYLVEEPMAAAIGIRLPVKEPVGYLVVDIGGGTTDIAVISLGGIVRSKNLKVAGNKLNSDIITYARDEFKLLLGDKTAEEVKIAIGSLAPQKELLEAVVRGRDLVTGLPKEIVITDADLKEAVGSSLAMIIDSIKEVLESTPPELVSDIMHNGIVMTGGGVLIAGLPELLAQTLKIPVNVAEDPMTAVVRGTGVILENLVSYQDIFVGEDETPSRKKI